ncbi:hypothetical protein CHL67_08470 [Prosthecochloris sp. GSB1]|uniref:hypothetical protein n=1 Tax=Prosthecochloris sp. GSB1 TaxID=281093 RepID=UPI000B8C9E91|nr:hypothetical protein [Prosthecochloris sp. GSB1]ASQ90945.1 hypothetical protein CHL67_08470 [Prosthecochloris sp. GSB1]
MIDLNIQPLQEPVTKRFRLSKSVTDSFELYVKAAQEKAPGVDESTVLEAILEKHFKRDRGFRSWLKGQDGQGEVSA